MNNRSKHHRYSFSSPFYTDSKNVNLPSLKIAKKTIVIKIAIWAQKLYFYNHQTFNDFLRPSWPIWRQNWFFLNLGTNGVSYLFRISIT